MPPTPYNPPAYGAGQYQAPIPGMGLPPEYSSELFTNLQNQSRGQLRAQNQQVLDNTSGNPAMSGVAQMMMRQNAQNQGNQALIQGTGAQLEGVNAALQDRRIRQQRDFEGQQNAENRQVTREGYRNAANMQQAGFGHENNANWLGLASGVAGMLGGPAMAAAGSGLGSWLGNQFGGGQRTQYGGGY